MKVCLYFAYELSQS